VLDSGAPHVDRSRPQEEEPLLTAINCLIKASDGLDQAAKERGPAKDGEADAVAHAELDLLAREADDVLSRVVATALDLGVTVEFTPPVAGVAPAAETTSPADS
jgi:hypothetical protein